MATLIIVAVAAFVVLLGAYGLAAPAGLVDFIKNWRSGTGLLAAAALRLIFGVALWVGAPASRVPLAFQVLGTVSILAGIVLPLMGSSRFESLLNWWLGQSAVFVRLWSLIALIFGGFLFWAVLAKI